MVICAGAGGRTNQQCGFAVPNVCAVIWRRISFGTQSAAGSVFVARMLTVVTTLHSQQRNVLEYLTDACRAARAGTPAPSLLPEKVNSDDLVLPAA